MRYFTFLPLSVFLLMASHAALADSGGDALQKALDKCARQHSEIRDMTIIQEITIPSPEGTLMAEQKSFEKGDKSRMEMTMQPPPGADTTGMPPSMGVITTIGDGKTTWLISPMTGKQEVPEKGDPSSANCWGLKLEHASVTGSGTADGRDCWIVESGTADSISDRYWLDKAKFDVLKGESKDPEGHILRWNLADFRPILGAFEYPYKMDVLSGDTVVASMRVKSITVNTGLADSLFDPDKVEVKQSDLQDMLRKLMEQQGADTTGSPEPDSAQPPQK